MEQELAFSLIMAHDYPIQLAEDIARAKKRVSITAMTLVNDCSEVDNIINGLIAAAGRGVSVSVSADSMTYLEPREHLLEFRERLIRVKQARAVRRKLASAGVDFRWLGETKVGMIGRVHSKWAIIDDIVYSFGGVNIDRQSFENIDYMFRTESHELADFLAKQHDIICNADAGGYSPKNTSIQFSNCQIIIDGGRTVRSAIYSRAKELASSAKSITLVSQYCPSGSLARLLKSKDSKIYFNPPDTTRGLNTLVVTLAMVASDLKTLYSKKQYLHAKCIIFAMPDGSKVAITGSHNFASLGILLGTREVALETNDPQLIANLENFISHNVASVT